MKKLLVCIVIGFWWVFSQSQVGIGTTNPQATLDVEGQPTNTSALDGVIPPRLTGAELGDKTYTSAQEGAIVYVTTADPSPAGQTINVTTTGYFYFNGTNWIALSANANVWENKPSDARVEMTHLSDGTTDRTAATSQFYMRDDGKLIIGDPLSTGLNGEADHSGFVNIRRSSGGANLKIASSDGNGIIFLEGYQNGNGSPILNFAKGRGVDSDYRNTSASGTETQLPVQDGDRLGALHFWGYNDRTGTNEGLAFSAALRVEVDGAVTTGNNGGVPTRMTFTTTTSSQAAGGTPDMTLDSNGRLGIGTTNPLSTLHVNGGVTKPFKFGNTVTDSDYTIVLTGNLTLPVSNADNKGRILVLCSDGSSRTVTGTFGSASNTNFGSFDLHTNDGQRCITIQSTNDAGRWWIISRD